MSGNWLFVGEGKVQGMSVKKPYQGKLVFFEEQNMNSPRFNGTILAMDWTQNDIKFVAASDVS